MKLFSGFSTRFLLKKILFLSIVLLFFVQNSKAQCTGGTEYALSTYNDPSISGVSRFTYSGQTYINNSITIANGTTLCVSTGTTLNLNPNSYNVAATDNVTVEVYGTLKFNTNPNLAGKWTFNIHTGGILNYGSLNFNSTSGSLILNNAGTFSGVKLEITGSSSTGSITNTGAMTLTDDINFAGISFNFYNNSSTTLNLKTIALSNSGSIFEMTNYSTMSVSSTLNLNNGTGKFRNLGTLTVGENYNSSSTSTYVNCGTYTGKFNLNGGGKVINTGTFNTTQIDFGTSASSIENYGWFTSSGSINASGLIYNEGVFTLSTGAQLAGDGNLKGPSNSSKKGYFVWSGENGKNSGTIGPNLNFRNSGGTSDFSTMFQGNTSSYIWDPDYYNTTWGTPDPTTLPVAACPNADGSPSTPVPTTSTACAGIDLTTLQPSYTNVTYEWFTGTETTRGTQVTSLTTPKVTCYTTIGTVYLWAKSNGSTLYSPTGAAVTITDCATAWKSIKTTGDWTDTDMWKYRDAAGAWFTIASPPYNNKPVYISDGTTVTIPATITTINADSLVIESTGKLVVSNAITINSPLVFEINQSGGAGQLLGACGKVTMGASSKLIARKTLDNTWDFISFPFAVANIYIANTTTKADWGDLSSNIVDGKEFIVAEYDALARANAGTISTNSTYFKSVSSHTFTAQKGYIITGGAGLTGINPAPSTITLDFVSAVGASLGFCDVPNAGTLSYITGTACPSGEGWNLVGTPYTAAYNLYYASTTASPALKPYYVYNGSTYTTVTTTPDNDYAINPFSAFFLQTTAATQALNYDDAGLTNLTSHTVGSSSAPAFRVSIMLSQDAKTDATTINLEENAATEYIKGEDVVKVSNSSSTAPQIYTEAEGACSALSINTMPMNTNRVNLKVRFGKLGLNTIKLFNAEKAIGFNTVTLVDTETTIQTNLLKDSYSFENTATGESSRFYIQLSQTGNTGLNEFSNDNIKAIVKDNEIQLTGLDGKARINIFDLVGKTIGVYKSVNNNEPIRIVKQGIYFIDILSDSQHSTVKVFIK